MSRAQKRRESGAW